MSLFVSDVKVCSNFIDLHVAAQLCQHHLLKRLSFPHCIFLPLYWRLVDPGYWSYFWGFYSIPLICMSMDSIDPCATTMLFWLLLLCSIVWSLGGLCLLLCSFFLWISLAIMGLLWFHINFRVICFSTMKTIMGKLIGITLGL